MASSKLSGASHTAMPGTEYEALVGGASHNSETVCVSDRSEQENSASREKITEALDLQCREYAADHLLEAANGWSVDEDTEPVTKEQFAARMTLTDISRSRRGKLQVYYDGGDLFDGHSIIVSVDQNGVIYRADVAG